MAEPSYAESKGLHIIIKGVLHDVELFPDLLDLSGSAVAEHLEGKVQKERPHYHCWVPKTTATKEQWKGLLRAYYDTKVPGLDWNRNANAYYTVKYHNSFDAWVTYASDPEEYKKASWVKWNCPGEPPKMRNISELILPAQGGATGPQNVIHLGPGLVVAKDKKFSSLEKQQRFLRYVKDSITEDEWNSQTAHSISRLFFRYCGQNGFTAMHGGYTYVNYVLSQLLTGTKLEDAESRFADILCSKFF